MFDKLDSHYAVICTTFFGKTFVINLRKGGKYENHHITHDIRVAQEVAEYMTETVGKLGYHAVKVNFEEIK